MGFLKDSGAANPLRQVERITGLTQLGLGASGAKNKDTQRKAAAANAVAAMAEAARRQRVDLMIQAEATSQAQAEAVNREAATEKAKGDIAKAAPTGSVDVSLGGPAAGTSATGRTRRRRQFGVDAAPGDYAPGVNL